MLHTVLLAIYLTNLPLQQSKIWLKFWLLIILQSLQIIIYFGAIVSVLYYLGIIEFVLSRVAWLMQYTVGTTAAESLNAAACIFLGQVGKTVSLCINKHNQTFEVHFLSQKLLRFWYANHYNGKILILSFCSTSYSDWSSNFNRTGT